MTIYSVLGAGVEVERHETSMGFADWEMIWKGGELVGYGACEPRRMFFPKRCRALNI